MKKNLFLWAVFAIMMTLAGCTQEEKIVYVEKEDGTGSEMQLEGNVLKISMSNSLTRAARPIKDNAADNNINRIQLRFFNSDDKSEREDISIAGIDNSLTYEGNVITIASNCPDEITVQLNMDAAAEKGIYIFAYGYNVTGDESPLALTRNQNFQANDGYVLLENQEVTNSVGLQEYFAGSRYAYINKYGLFNESPQITLKRQVAGLLAYLKNIPAVLNDKSGVTKVVKYITVNTSKTITGLVMPAEGIYQDEGNDGREKEGKFANGYTGEKGTQELLRFDLTSAKRNPSTALTYTFDANTAIGGVSLNKVIFADGMDATKFSGMKFADNTLFGSCFILPFDHPSYSPVDSYPYTALYISYLDEDGDVINTALLNMSTGSGNNQNYSIWANHFYSIGTKISDANGDDDKDGNPENDDDEEDNPLDIGGKSGTDEMILNVDDMWEDVALIRPTE